MSEATKVEVKEEKKDSVLHADTVLYILYLFYKANILTRHNVRNILRLIRQPLPENLAKFLAEEEQKAV